MQVWTVRTGSGQPEDGLTGLSGEAQTRPGPVPEHRVGQASLLSNSPVGPHGRGQAQPGTSFLLWPSEASSSVSLLPLSGVGWDKVICPRVTSESAETTAS